MTNKIVLFCEKNHRVPRMSPSVTEQLFSDPNYVIGYEGGHISESERIDWKREAEQVLDEANKKIATILDQLGDISHRPYCNNPANLDNFCKILMLYQYEVSKDIAKHTKAQIEKKDTPTFISISGYIGNPSLQSQGDDYTNALKYFTLQEVFDGAQKQGKKVHNIDSKYWRNQYSTGQSIIDIAIQRSKVMLKKLNKLSSTSNALGLMGDQHCDDIFHQSQGKGVKSHITYIAGFNNIAQYGEFHIVNGKLQNHAYMKARKIFSKQEIEYQQAIGGLLEILPQDQFTTTVGVMMEDKSFIINLYKALTKSFDTDPCSYKDFNEQDCSALLQSEKGMQHYINMMSTNLASSSANTRAPMVEITAENLAQYSANEVVFLVDFANQKHVELFNQWKQNEFALPLHIDVSGTDSNTQTNEEL